MEIVKSKRPDFTSDEAKQILSDKYNLFGELKELVSERDQNFYVKAVNNEEYVLKIANCDELFDILDCQNKAMLHLAQYYSPPICPIIINSSSGEQIVSINHNSKTNFIRLLTYLPGIPLAETKTHSVELVYSVGEFIGNISNAFQSFKHTAAKREIYWDLKKAYEIICEYKTYITDDVQNKLIDHFLNCYTITVKPVRSKLRQSFLHNDGNDYNILTIDELITGIIDFGDSVYSHTVNEPAVAAAYLILGKENPIETLKIFLKGYNKIFPLTATEMDVIFYLICMRLCQSVTIAAYQRKMEPNNEYLSITESQAWQLLNQLKKYKTTITGESLS
jgi:Ser/Thr protein kinase RdoA (MazF antagonist)